MFRYLIFFLFCSLSLLNAHPLSNLPSREDQINRLEDKEFDLLIIGGGASGAGVALNASLRGLQVLLIDKNDFASQTSSKSTKLAHGGVRYLEKALLQLDKKQYALVTEALRERGALFAMAPFALSPVKLITPVYTFFKLPYMWLGLKVYDLISRRASLGPSRFISSGQIKKLLPDINTKKLKGGIVYFDGQFNDTRLNIMTILTAMSNGALALNYTEAKGLIKDKGKIVGAIVKDTLTGSSYTVRSKVVINATGPFSDTLRKMDNKDVASLICTSAGSHIILDKKFTEKHYGMLIPKTKDGRVLFMLPWQGSTIVGTTDVKADLQENPLPSEEEIDYMLSQCSEYLNKPLSRADIKSVWTGLRPLVRDLKQNDTSKLCRNHIIEVSDSNLISLMGGKWTTFRKMGEECVDVAIRVGNLKASDTKECQLIGSAGYNCEAALNLTKETDLDLDITQHLIQSYGMLAFDLVKEGSLKRINPNYPFIDAEISWAMNYEYAQNLADVLTRRMRLATLDKEAALNSIHHVTELILENSKSDDVNEEEFIANLY